MSPQPPPPPPPPPGRSSGGPGSRPDQVFPRWAIWVLLGVVAAVFLLSGFLPRTEPNKVSYSEMLTQVEKDQVDTLKWDNNDGSISGTKQNGDKFESNGPKEPSDHDRQVFQD